jgi:ferritin-like metal-binding protein YciE
MKKKGNINDLFIKELKDIYSAEGQIVKSLPNLAKAADSEDLRDAFQSHLEETKEHVKRLNKIFDILQETPKGETCEAMHGLIQECSDTIHEFSKSALRDAALISKAQRIEHYEISAYGTLRTFAKELDLNDDVIDLLQETLREESSADKILTKIAEGSLMTTGINRKANDY